VDRSNLRDMEWAVGVIRDWGNQPIEPSLVVQEINPT
jgi:hypothetical protein